MTSVVAINPSIHFLYPIWLPDLFMTMKYYYSQIKCLAKFVSEQLGELDIITYSSQSVNIVAFYIICWESSQTMVRYSYK